MLPAFRMIPKLIVCWNYAKGGIDDNSRVLKKCDPPFRGFNGHALT